MRRFFLGWMLWGLVAQLAAGADLTLEQAMTTARQQAREVIAARARVEAGAQRLRQAKSYRWPKLSLEEIWMRSDSPAEAFALQLNQERFSFPDFVASDPNDPDPVENALTRLQLSLPLYTGGELGGRIRQAELASEAASESAVWVEDGAALAAAEAYIQLAQARDGVALLERALQTVAAHVELARAYVDQGMLVRSELLRAQVERSRIEDLLSEARGQARVAAASLSYRLAADLASPWHLEALPHPDPLAGDLDSWVASADSRRDLEAARRQLRAGELEIKVQRSGLLPKIGLVGRYDLNDDALFGSNGESAAVMAVARIDLFSGGRHRAAAAVARAEAEAARLDIERFREGIRVEVRDAFEKALTARERHATALEAQAAAAEVERIIEERFKSGVVQMIDLLDASTARREAEMRELVARAEAHLASLRLAVRAGRKPESVLAPSRAGKPQTDADPAKEHSSHG
jgi:outer membrane protein TolC